MLSEIGPRGVRLERNNTPSACEGMFLKAPFFDTRAALSAFTSSRDFQPARKHTPFLTRDISLYDGYTMS